MIEEQSLSPRERVVVQMLWDGLQNKEVALALGLSIKSIQNYRRTIYLKLGVNNGIQLARYAVEHGLVPLNKVSV